MKKLAVILLLFLPLLSWGQDTLQVHCSDQEAWVLLYNHRLVWCGEEMKAIRPSSVLRSLFLAGYRVESSRTRYRFIGEYSKPQKVTSFVLILRKLPEGLDFQKRKREIEKFKFVSK